MTHSTMTSSAIASPAAALLVASLLAPVGYTNQGFANESRPATPAAPVSAKPQAGAASAKPADAAAAGKLDRGKYLVTTAGCHDCHTPLKMGPNGPERDMERMLSGHPESLVMPPVPKLPEGPWLFVAAGTTTAHAGPWGVSFTANLTPDAETGLGKWTFQNFKDTIRTGRHMGRGRPILPPMPIPMYKHFTDADLELIWGYLRSIPPISNRVPEPVPPPEPTN
jgi:mono/diheme cytochrome c family protein